MATHVAGKDLIDCFRKQGIPLPENIKRMEFITEVDEINEIVFTCNASPEVMKVMYMYACEVAKE